MVKERQRFLGKIQQRLAERREALARMLFDTTHNKVSDGQVQDSGDEALSLTMETLQSSIEQSEIDELRLIDEALSRIEKNEYGQCVDCQEPIAEKRLEHFPYAARCIVCQEVFEE